jgi:uncharacterized protein GlcG (DUF336 family)
MRVRVTRGTLVIWLVASLTAPTIAGCGAVKERDEARTTSSPASPRSNGCSDVLGGADLVKLLRAAPTREGADAGGLNHGKFMWGAVVNREGQLCSVAVSTDDAAATWPGSRGIAIAKAFTANAFSTDTVPLSTARLYTLSQPGHSLWGAGAGNPINPACLSAPGEPNTGVGKVCGGTIVFGGGLPLYKGQTRVGGLGVSGDTSCADHEIAKRVRDAAGLNPPTGRTADDIVYTSKDGPSPFAHPLCANTWRNGEKIGDEAPASGY